MCEGHEKRGRKKRLLVMTLKWRKMSKRKILSLRLQGSSIILGPIALANKCLPYRDHFEEAMKYARRSVSDQDIRRYEMFSQVCILIRFLQREPGLTCASRTCNNLVASATTSSSLKVIPLAAVLLPRHQTPTQ